MHDVVLLDDDPDSIRLVQRKLRDIASVICVTNTEDFRAHVDAGGRAKLYFLDDMVPSSGAKKTIQAIYR